MDARGVTTQKLLMLSEIAYLHHIFFCRDKHVLSAKKMSLACFLGWIFFSLSYFFPILRVGSSKSHIQQRSFYFGVCFFFVWGVVSFPGTDISRVSYPCLVYVLECIESVVLHESSPVKCFVWEEIGKWTLVSGKGSPMLQNSCCVTWSPILQNSCCVAWRRDIFNICSNEILKCKPLPIEIVHTFDITFSIDL